MSAINSGRAWEVGFRSAVRAGRLGWSVIKATGSVRLRVRIKGSTDECVVLPVKWEPRDQEDRQRLEWCSERPQNGAKEWA
jgi:hypothetical protein